MRTTLLLCSVVALLNEPLCRTHALAPDRPRVDIRVVRDEAVACHVPLDSLNQWLDIIIEDVTGSGVDIIDNPQGRTVFELEIPRPLPCPTREGNIQAEPTVRAACELSWFNLLTGKREILTARTTLVCQPE